MNLKMKLSSTVALLALASGCAIAQAPVTTQNGVLTGANGMTLYTFDKDTAGSGKSVCNGPCATNWPPLTAATAPAGADYSVIKRDDGTSQIAYKGKPLYYWVKDTKPGDKTGDGVNQVWRTATP
ncbi:MULTISPECIES: hypothetical protein [unclassified Acidovorax]|uniref:COG4315 family predicted lipoprotein n=1 Tax=unclassified Acidovorax TaxID=2684926 RepID=UPI0028830D91|nr:MULTISPECIES: hypothetical protein [unclassified Acidovorax]